MKRWNIPLSFDMQQVRFYRINVLWKDIEQNIGSRQHWKEHRQLEIQKLLADSGSQSVNWTSSMYDDKFFRLKVMFLGEMLLNYYYEIG